MLSLIACLEAFDADKTSTSTIPQSLERMTVEGVVDGLWMTIEVKLRENSTILTLNW